MHKHEQVPIHKIRVALCFKDFACWLMNASSVGLNVAGYTTAKVLAEHGIQSVVFPVRHNVDLVQSISKYNHHHHQHPLTHIVISAPWLSVHDLKALVTHFKDISFVVLSHSNVGFLQADAEGVKLLREYQKLKYSNLRIGGNSKKFVSWMCKAYEEPVIYLPNLYSTKEAIPLKLWHRRSLKIGAFGVVRPYKNFITSAAAALVLHKTLKVPVEFHMSEGGESAPNRIEQAIEEMLKDTGVTLIKHEWMYWDSFIKLVGSMDLLLQVSYTESFNLVTADGVLTGIPSVVSTAIEWAPEEWKADSDDALEVARIGLKLLRSPDGLVGIKALDESNLSGIEYWKDFLGFPDVKPEKKPWYKRWEEEVKEWLGISQCSIFGTKLDVLRFRSSSVLSSFLAHHPRSSAVIELIDDDEK